MNIVLKWNNTCVREECPVCGNSFKAGWGMYPFLEGTWSAICQDCLIVEDPLYAHIRDILGPMTMDIIDHMNTKCSVFDHHNETNEPPF